MAAAALASAPTALLSVRGVSKRFPGVAALERVDLDVAPGEVVAVIGENGAGKSTLMKILGGVHSPDEGRIEWDGAAVAIDSVRRASQLGIALIHQELNLCDNLSAGANVWLGREPRGRFGWFAPRTVDELARPFLERVGLRASPSTPLDSLGIGQRQLVEIAKALSQRARLVIMDEPTSSLTVEESAQLFDVIAELRRSGVAVLYISHRLGEVEALADRVVALRDGRNSGVLERAGITHTAMVRLMVGRDIEVRPRVHGGGAGAVRLELCGIRTRAWPAHAIDLTVRAGEIVGLAGLVGAGRSELLETVFGARAAHAGRVRVDGVDLRGGNLREAIRAGIALVPEDRKQQGLVLDMPIGANLTLASLPEHRRSALRGLGVLDRAREARTAQAAIERLDVRSRGPQQAARDLSGGNQQKVVLGKWLARDPRVLLLDEPTRGVDIAAKDEIYRRMEQLAGQGVAILFASSEMAEILSLADRVVVLHEGRLAGELSAARASEQTVMALATGAADEASR